MGNTEKTIATAYKVTLTDNALFNIGEITGCMFLSIISRLMPLL